jgi:glutaredoxin-like protein NrdH
MNLTHVDGKDLGKIVLYALSTCPWCKKTKKFLEDSGVAYDFIDVDLLGGDDREQTIQSVTRWNPQCSFPTMVINNSKCIIGYNEKEIRDNLKIQ